MTDCIQYKNGYNNRLWKDYTIQTDIRPERAAKSKYIHLFKNGKLVIRGSENGDGYHWDGATRAKETKSNKRASLVHDALYGLLRDGLLDMKWRRAADQLFRDIMREDSKRKPSGWSKWTGWGYASNGFGWVRSRYSYAAVRVRGDNALKAPFKELLHAPRGCP